MAIREVTPPARGRTRKAKYPFSNAEIESAVKMLKAGKTPGVGPYEGENALREARSAAQSLVRFIGNAEPSLNVGTRAWEDDNGQASGCVILKD